MNSNTFCTGCQSGNPEGAKFCINCGNALTTACAKCGTELPEGAKFCMSCGQELVQPLSDSSQPRLQQYIPKELLAKLESARATGGVQGERRIVTMLFCDVQGSTAAAEKLDPEEWAEIMNGAFEHLIAPVYRYEGTLARLMGDAILAFFGAPITHEDDPQRAVLAALEIIERSLSYREQVQSSWGVDFNVRAGINTGLVVVGEVGSDLRVEYTAMGDAVNLAARMEQTARPGTVQITSETYRLVAPLFEFEDLGGIEVKGKSEPVQSYRVLRAREEPGPQRGIVGLDSPLIGRDQEMDKLVEIIAELRQGRGQIVSVMGEAGLGKSRLIAELRKGMVSDGRVIDSNATSDEGTDNESQPLARWYEGRSFSFETSTPYAPFVTLFSKYFDLRTEETNTAKYDKIKAQLKQLLPDRVEEVAPVIGLMMGIALEGEEGVSVAYLQPPQVRDKVFHATSELVERLAQVSPLVLVFEDLHWVDPTSLDLIEHLMPLTDRVALMLMAVFRPWRQDPSWRFHEMAIRDFTHRHTSIMLEPLDDHQARELVANLLHIEGLPEKVRALVLLKAEGNPFYIEEVIRSLLDTGSVVRENSHWRVTRDIENIAVPDTLAGVITSRLDRLSEKSKSAAQAASVIGREFRFDILNDVHEAGGVPDEALIELQRRDLIREKTRLPQQIYLFKHVLTQETVYSSLLHSQRRQLHRRVAECLEQVDPERVSEIARHFLEAKEEPRALPYLVEAGDHAARAYSTGEAIGYYTRALEIVGTNKDPRLARLAYEGLGSALTFANDIGRAVENYHLMLHAAQDYDDQPMQVSALNKLGFVTALAQGQFPEAEEHFADAERLALACGDLPGLAELHMNYCYLRVPFGDFEDAVDHLRESARIGRELDLEEPKLFGLTHTANTLTYMTRFDEAWQVAQEALALAEELDNRKWQAELLSLSISLHHLVKGDLDKALTSAQEGANRAERIGAAEQEAYGAMMLGQIAWLRGEYEQAITHQKRMLEAGRTAGLPFLEAAALSGLGSSYLDISDQYLDQVKEFHATALSAMDRPLGTLMGTMVWAQLGFGAMAAGNLEEASGFFQKGLTVPTALRYLARPYVLIGSAFVALAKGSQDEADQLVLEARAFIEEREMKHLEPLVHLATGQVCVATGATQRALEYFASAEALALEMQMRPLILQARLGEAGVLASLGRAEERDVKLTEARDMIGEIAECFQDKSTRDLYVKSATEMLG